MTSKIEDIAIELYRTTNPIIDWKFVGEEKKNGFIDHAILILESIRRANCKVVSEDGEEIRYDAFDVLGAEDEDIGI